MFCIAKQPLSQRQSAVITFQENYLYKIKVVLLKFSLKYQKENQPHSLSTKP